MHRVLPCFVTLFSLTLCAPAAVLVDDTWSDGSRSEQGLPNESAWYASTASSLTASTGEMVGTASTSSRMWLTYFTAAGSPVTLEVGQALKATLAFTPAEVVAAPNTSRGFRLGLYNFSAPGATRQTADTFSTSGLGANVPGYMINMNFATTFTTDNPMQIMERTDVANANLMGSTTAYTVIGSGPTGVSTDASFASGTPYRLELLIARTGLDSVGITAGFFDGGTWSVSHSVNDLAGATYAFDGLSIRVNNQADAAQSFTFTQFEVEVVPEPSAVSLLALGLLALVCRRSK